MPIKTLFEWFNKVVEFSAAGNNPYTPLQVVTTAHQLIPNTGIFPDYCREWKRKQEGYNTWANLKTYFTTAHLKIQYNEQSNLGHRYQAQANISTYQQEANRQETVDDLACLKTPTATYPKAVENITEKNRASLQNSSPQTKTGRSSPKSVKSHRTYIKPHKLWNNPDR